MAFAPLDAYAAPVVEALTVRRGLAVVAACLCAGGGVAVAWADSGSGDEDDPSLFTYDTLLGETVPIVNDADLRAGFISPTAVEGPGTVAVDEGLSPPIGESADELRMETAEPQPYPPEILRVSYTPDPPDARTAFYPPTVINATTAYDVYDGTTGVTVWAGGIEGDVTRGVFLKTVESAAPDSGEPQMLYLAGTGPITLTRFDGNNLFFSSASGETGVYVIGTGKAHLFPANAAPKRIAP
jgi:hypothetical protein